MLKTTNEIISKPAHNIIIRYLIAAMLGIGGVGIIVFAIIEDVNFYKIIIGMLNLICSLLLYISARRKSV